MKASLKKNALLKFLIFSGSTYLILYLIYQFLIKKFTLYDQKFIGTIILSAESFLKLFHFKTFVFLQDNDYQVIGIDGSNGVWVGSNCNAISLFILFTVFIAWYPGYQKAKIWFIPFGMISIHILNILRVIALTLIANYYPNWLNFNHTYTFTFLVYAYIFMLWVWWINRYAIKKSSES